LLASPKDAAENVMIVDLMRNDLGRVCRYGTVWAEPPAVEAHAGVWQLVSKVTGELRPGVTDGELLRAAFPPGSVTGAPKVQAMKVIAMLEATRREAYTGAIGIASPVAGLDLSVAIRTFEYEEGRTGDGPRLIWLGAGGGIVADSDPDSELLEAIAKARGPIAALGGEICAEYSPIRAADARASVRLTPALLHGHRPDPTIGVFETLLFENGVLVQPTEHLLRLTDSVSRLYGAELEDAELKRLVDETVGGLAGQTGRWRLRIDVSPDGSTKSSVKPASSNPTPARLLPFALPGGLGAHKWRDRGLLDALTDAAGGAVPLIVDTDGAVLEAAHANIWIREGDALITPPNDGRLLPGITRANWLTTRLTAREECFSLRRLASADEVLLTSTFGGQRVATAGARREH
jgi:para-aminobenzoate synthetase/4-amino-4-deoxychorismate lyase